MLLHTNEQQAAVNQAREIFDNTEEAYGRAGTGLLVGNSAPIGPEAWRRIDQRVTRVQRNVLSVFDRLARANTTPVGVGDIMSYYPKITDSGEAQVSMDGRSNALQDQANVTFVGTPVPVIDSFIRLGWRQGEVLRKQNGMAIDVESMANAGRRVAEKLEDMALNGLPQIVVQGSPIYGLLNFPDRSTDTHGFTLATATGAQWLTAVGKVITQLEADKAYGKVTLFLNWGDWSYATRTDYTANYPKTIIQRIMELGQVAEIIPASNVPANQLVGIANIDTGEWGSVLSAMAPTSVVKNRANAQDDYVQGHMAMAATQFRSDASAQSQIAHVTQ
jgi:hypothetical protein